MKRILLTVVAALICAGLSAQSLRKDFERLDAALGAAGGYVSAHERKIENINSMLLSPGISDETRLNLQRQLYETYVAYKFEAASDALDAWEETALRIGDPSRLTDVLLKKAMTYTAAGMFIEAQQILMGQIDTTSLTPVQLAEYYNVQQRFCFDYQEYSQTPEIRTILQARAGYYRGRVIDSTPAGDWLHRHMVMRDHIENGRYEEARDSSLALIAATDPESHDYAISAYYQAQIYDLMGDDDASLHWYVESAIADVKNSVKDNASLSCISLKLFQRGDLERAFRYIQISLNDALEFNAKIRPWQIAQNLPAIESAYADVQRAQSRTKTIFTIILGLLAAALVAILFYVIRLLERNRAGARAMEQLNQRLTAAYADLKEANAAKEEYLGLFLSMCSSYLGKLKKLYTMDQMDAELKNFYSTFDNAFIQLYPDFVTKFNSLLRPESRIELRKDEVLTTELRIFALIKLGITQSSHIASLLRYSVNTIYNYRAQIKNAALKDRENFEEQVRNL